MKNVYSVSTEQHEDMKLGISRFKNSTISQAVFADAQTRREPQRGPGKHSRRVPKHFCGAPLGKNF